MKQLPFMLMVTLLTSAAVPAVALDDFGAEEEVGDLFADTSAPTANAATNNKVLSAFISSRIPASSAKNIENAEKVFCYTVEYAQADYTGYTINDMAITGSCGELSTDGRSLIRDMVLNNNLVFSAASDNCNVSPRIMLRYVNGIDSTDVLFSAPCHSLTFFHGRDISTLNAAPGKNIIEQIVTTYSSLGEKFLSPALLGQMVPNGQIITQDQKEIVRKLSTAESPKKWNNNTASTTQSSTETTNNSSTPAAKKGWNRLK